MKTSASILFVTVLCLQLAAKAAVPYSPASDPAVFEWLKADAISQSANSPVSSWTASTGTSLVNPDGTTQPVFGASRQNGLPAVQFNGSAFLSSAATFSAVPPPFTIVMVFQYLDAPDLTEIFLSGTAFGNDVRIGNSGERDQFGIFSGAPNYSSGGPLSDNQWHAFLCVFNGATSQYRIDGGTNTVFGSSPGNNAINSIVLGNYQGNTNIQPAKLNLGEVIFYQGDQSANETAIFAYLTNRWGITSVSSSSSAPSPVASPPGSVNMIWNPVANAVGYTLYWGTASGKYTQSVSCPSSQTNLPATGLVTNGVYYLAVTATASDATESPYSNERIYTNGVVPVGVQTPTGFHVVTP